MEKILDVVATETDVLIPDKLINPMDCVPIPVRFVLCPFDQKEDAVILTKNGCLLPLYED